MSFDVDPELLRRRDTVLARAAVLAEGPGSNYVASGHKQPDSTPPSGDVQGLFDLLVSGFASASTEAGFARAVYFAERAVRSVQKQAESALGIDGKPKESYDERSDRLIDEYEGCSPEEVAYWELGITGAHMKRLRWINDRDPQTGQRVKAHVVQWSTPYERAQKAKALKRRHPDLSARAIALKLGVSHTLVLSDLKRRDMDDVAA